MPKGQIASMYPCDYGKYSGLQVLQSAAGFYIGTTFEHTSGEATGLVEPGSRESEYYSSRGMAEAALSDMSFTQRDHP